MEKEYVVTIENSNSGMQIMPDIYGAKILYNACILGMQMYGDTSTDIRLYQRDKGAQDLGIIICSRFIDGSTYEAGNVKN